MIVSIKSLDFTLTSGLKTFVEARTRLILSRYGDRISRIDVTLLDVNGPKGGADKRCRIKVSIAGMPPVVIQDTHEDMYEAINSCSGRARRALRRKLSKDRQVKPPAIKSFKQQEQITA